MRSADEHYLCVPHLDDLLKLARVPIALVGIELPEDLKKLATSEEILESTRRPLWSLGQPHAREADLVEVEHFLQIAPRSIQDAENQGGSVVATVALLRDPNRCLVKTADGHVERARIDLRSANSAAGTNLVSSRWRSISFALRSCSGASTGKPRR
jgi:hypothetical protein